MSPTPVWRPTARVLAVDPDGRLLLFSSVDPEGATWWFTPGGGVQRGETLTAAAVRELAGLVVRLLHGDVPSRPVRLPWTPDPP